MTRQHRRPVELCRVLAVCVAARGHGVAAENSARRHGRSGAEELCRAAHSPCRLRGRDVPALVVADLPGRLVDLAAPAAPLVGEDALGRAGVKEPLDKVDEELAPGGVAPVVHLRVGGWPCRQRVAARTKRSGQAPARSTGEEILSGSPLPASTRVCRTGNGICQPRSDASEHVQRNSARWPAAPAAGEGAVHTDARSRPSGVGTARRATTRVGSAATTVRRLSCSRQWRRLRVLTQTCCIPSSLTSSTGLPVYLSASRWCGVEGCHGAAVVSMTARGTPSRSSARRTRCCEGEGMRKLGRGKSTRVCGIRQARAAPTDDAAPAERGGHSGKH